MTHGISDSPRQIRWPRVGSVWITRARVKPRMAFQSTARKVKMKENRRTIQKVSWESR